MNRSLATLIYFLVLLCAACGANVTHPAPHELRQTIGDCDDGGEPSIGGTGGAAAGMSGGGMSGGGMSGGGMSGGSPSCDLSGYTVDVWREAAAQPQAVGRSGNEYRFATGIAVGDEPGELYAAWGGFNDQTFDALEGGLHKTSDCGATWAELGAFDHLSGVAVSGDELYAWNGVRGDLGLWYSADDGVTWTQRTLAGAPDYQSLDDVGAVSVDPANFAHLVVSFHSAGSLGSGLVESNDKGVTWAVRLPEPSWGPGSYVAMIDSSSWLLGTQGAGWWRTTNSGASWSQFSTTNMSHGGSTLYRDDTDALWVGTACNGLRSTDNGATWAQTPSWWNCSNWGAVGGYGNRVFTKAFYTWDEMGAATSDDPHNSWVAVPVSPNDASGSFAEDTQAGVLYGSFWGAGIWAVRTR